MMLQLPFALLPVITFISDRRLMGEFRASLYELDLLNSLYLLLISVPSRSSLLFVLLEWSPSIFSSCILMWMTVSDSQLLPFQSLLYSEYSIYFTSPISLVTLLLGILQWVIIHHSTLFQFVYAFIGGGLFMPADDSVLNTIKFNRWHFNISEVLPSPQLQYFQSSVGR